MMKKKRPFTESISLTIEDDPLPAIGPSGPGDQLVVTATDASGTVTTKEIVPQDKPLRRRPRRP